MIDALKRDFPGRFFFYFKLDDIVKQSMNIHQKIFRFANLEMTNTYLEKIKEVVSANPKFLRDGTKR